MNLIGFFILSLFAAHNKTLLWTANGPEQHVQYWTVEMQMTSTSWFRMGSTKQPQFLLPYGPYVRTFRVIAWPEPYWPLPPSPPSQPITTHL